jgi:hypothetical protein
MNCINVRIQSETDCKSLYVHSLEDTEEKIINVRHDSHELGRGFNPVLLPYSVSVVDIKLSVSNAVIIQGNLVIK